MSEFPRYLCLVVVTLLCHRATQIEASDSPHVTASSIQHGTTADGAVDPEIFSTEPRHLWRGHAGESQWWWQCEWDQPREVGAILQVVGDDPLELNHAPRNSVWQSSLNGVDWLDLMETAVETETRMFRLQRLNSSIKTRFLRLKISSAWGDVPVLRHVQFYAAVDAAVPFPDWCVVVSTVDRSEMKKGEGKQFVTLARSCPDQSGLAAQFLWLDRFDEQFISVEPRPICAFLSGNFSDFCQKEREVWRGTAGIVKSGQLPIWAACGGAQGLAILSDTGVDKPWDCPHCRDPLNPKSPIYGHIGHVPGAPLKCGDYQNCLFEKGATLVLAMADDPVLDGLPREFSTMESHCGQIEYLPKGWTQIVTKGTGGKTNIQCMRLKDRPIYAAQFHIEMDGTPESSRCIMSNFLKLAKEWNSTIATKSSTR